MGGARAAHRARRALVGPAPAASSVSLVPFADAAVELSQLLNNRATDVDDLIMNTLFSDYGVSELLYG